MPVRRIVLAACAVLAVSVALSALGWASPGDLVVVSQTSGGANADHTSLERDISKDGRYVAFISNATNLGASVNQAFVRDVASGTTTLVSVGSDGSTPANAAVDSVTVSDDGQHAAFHTRATNIVAGVSTPSIDRSYVRDLGTDTTTLVAGAPDDDAVNPAISGDGTEVAFASHAHYDGLNSVSLQTYVRDVGASTIHAVSVGMTVADQPAISESGRYVAVRGQQNGVSGRQVWLRDRTAGTTTLVSRASGDAGAAGTADSDTAAISADGRFVVFRSGSENLSTDDDPAHGNTDVYERDIQESTTTLVSRADGATGAYVPFPDDSGTPTVSDDGRLVLFVSTDDALASVAGNGNNVYLRDLDTGATTLVSAKDDGTAPPVGSVDGASVSGDGLFAAFATSAALKAGVTGNVEVYRRELASAAPPPPPPVVSIGDAGAIAEGAPGQVTQALFSLTLDHASPKPVSVPWSTVDGSATGGSDFRSAAGQALFDPGQTTATVAVDVLGDADFEGDETFQVAIHDAVNAGIGRGAGTATIRNDDAQPSPPPRSTTPSAPPPAASLPDVSGAPVADCQTRITRGQAHLTGCFSGDTAHGKVAINGLLVTPDSAGTSISATESRISSSNSVTVTAGDVVVSRGDLDLDPRSTGVAGVLTPTDGSSLYGLGLAPKLSLSWAPNAGVVLKGGVSPRFGTVLGTPLQVSLSADASAGMHRDRLTAGAPASIVGRLITTDLQFTFVPSEDRWTGSLLVTSPFFSAIKVVTHIAGATGVVTGVSRMANAIVNKVVKVRTFDITLLTNPLRIQGTLDAVGGPLDMFAFNGTLTDDLSTSAIKLNGSARLYGIPINLPNINLTALAASFASQGIGGVLFHVGGGMSTSLPAGSSSPAVQVPNFPLQMEGGVLSALSGGLFMRGAGSGHATVLGVDISGQWFFSERGFGACGQVGPLNVGFGVAWNPFSVQAMGPFVCDIGAFKSAAGGRAAVRAAGQRTVRLGKGKQLLRLTGDTAPPQVVLAGPGGRTVTVPAADQPPLVSHDVVVMRESGDEEHLHRAGRRRQRDVDDRTSGRVGQHHRGRCGDDPAQAPGQVAPQRTRLPPSVELDRQRTAGPARRLRGARPRWGRSAPRRGDRPARQAPLRPAHAGRRPHDHRDRPAERHPAGHDHRRPLHRTERPERQGPLAGREGQGPQDRPEVDPGRRREALRDLSAHLVRHDRAHGRRQAALAYAHGHRHRQVGDRNDHRHGRGRPTRARAQGERAASMTSTRGASGLGLPSPRASRLCSRPCSWPSEASACWPSEAPGRWPVCGSMRTPGCAPARACR